jgi:hypothetical protein
MVSGIVAVVACVMAGCSHGSSPLHSAASPFAPSAPDVAAENACRTIVNNTDTLLLKQDLSGLDPLCLRFVGGSGALNCQGHDVQGIDLSDVHGLVIRNCRLRSIVETGSSEITFADNVVTADPRKTVGAALRFSDGNNNRIVGNTIDGNWRGQPYPPGGFPPGADDGIVIDNEGNTVIESNAIRNVWDCGIERIGNRTDPVTIRNNDIANAAECGIGSWFAAGWHDSLVAGNSVSNSGVFIELFFSPTQNKGVDHITLRNNVFEDNHFGNPSSQARPSVSIDYLSGAARLPLDIGNNVFRNNDFGSDIPAPRLNPSAGFVDGGENICRQDTKSSLNCAR